ncbi:MAG: hypothetical protein H0T51_26435, partial [Pirellulales bacterium]|nr:hypothetical protein [Pirellulales bacterium]
MTGQQFDGSGRLTREGREARLAGYLAAAGAAATALAGDADAAIVGNTATQSFGINGAVSIDFNADGQTDFQVDHDRYNLSGTNLDYLQIDKNDVNSETDPFPTDFTQGFPPGSTVPNDNAEAAYVTASQGSYPSALTAGANIGPDSTFDFQEGDNYLGGGQTIRANRLIDEDQTQIDQQVGGLTPDKVVVPTNGPNWVGLGGEVRYLGLKMDLNNTNQFTYGWVGVRIDNEADATGAVVGYAYESTPGAGILAGQGPAFVSNADYDDDGDVDGNDFLVWQRQLGSTVTAGTGADGNGDTMVNGLDLTLWRSNFGSATAAGEVSAVAVPEP